MGEASRLARLAAAQWAEKGRAYLWFLAVGIGVHACVVLMFTASGTALENYVLDVQPLLYRVGLVATALLFAGRYFESLGAPGPALTLLMRPASSAQKWLLALLVVGVLYPLAYTLAFQVCNVPAALLAEAAWVHDKGVLSSVQRDFGIWIPFTRADNVVGDAYLAVLVLGLQGFMVCATLYFRRLALLKAFVSLFVTVLAMLFAGIVSEGNPEALLQVHDASAAIGPGWRAWMVLVWVGVPALLWLAAWRLLRERELR